MKAAVILSGCGVFDGSEIQEAVLCLLALREHGYTYDCFAPDQEMVAVSHLSQKPGSSRNVLEESARIARGKIQEISKLDSTEYDLLVLPGGMGVGKNWSNFLEAGEALEVIPSLKKVVENFFDEKKPIVAICMATIILAKVLQTKGSFKLTMGRRPENISMLQKLGMQPVPKHGHEMVQDGNLFTAPAYYEASSIEEIYQSLKAIFHALEHKCC